MKKVYMIFISILSISIFLFGCSTKEKAIKEDFGLEKVQKIEVSSVDNPELVLNVIDNKENVNKFMNALKVDKWSIADIPSNATKENIYKMYQEETIKFGESSNKDEKKLKQIATIITYEDSPYINVKTKNLNFNFNVPKDVSKYLSNQNN
ncbi:hypothetical protein [Ectobacillus panaciterrae]|uniref:hypothetical protein n=1 Tax=Ectobacillus panaciterrae TaxID=363872 RepID=UPI00040E864F|nr:hypothetical protein [Ectobacillus panaciterrae]